jgi:transcriptional regulator with XRE-family HTH domain
MKRAREVFARKIRFLRAGRSFRVFSKDIEEKTGAHISHTALHDYEKPDGQDPKYDTLDALSRYADVKPSWFFDDDGCPGNQPGPADLLNLMLREEGLEHQDIAFLNDQVERFIAYAKAKRK